MKTTSHIVNIATLILATAFSTGGNSHDTSNSNDTTSLESMQQDASLYVDIQTLQPTTFHNQLICNGRLKAIRKSELSFQNSGIVTHVAVNNGSRVAPGQVIARTDESEAKLNLSKAKRDLERATITLTDKLIGQGYSSLNDSIPHDLLERLRVAVGWHTAQYAVQNAHLQLAACVLRAPFGGRIANLTTLRNQRIDKICDIVDDQTMLVEFNVLEAELHNVRKGIRVEVTPLVGGRTVTGSIQNINPSVSDKGLIRITAAIPNPSGTLLDGENVKVVIEHDVPNCYVVPKQAVVERDGFHVVFLLHDGHAVWTYVDIAQSNATQCAIIGCTAKETQLHAGDTVITTGNANLADGTPVKLKR